MTPPAYVVGIDAGGTKTHLRACTVGGEALADHVVASGDWSSLDAAGKADFLVRTLDSTPFREPDAVGIGAHGCDSDDECEELRAAIAERLACPASVVNDAVLLQYVADRPFSANLVLGTGSIVVAATAAGTTLYAGGWGWLIGDPGSAWGIVRESVRRLAADLDAGRPGDELLPMLLRHTGRASLRDVVDDMQRAPGSVWASWAPVVFDADRRGSAAARGAIDDSADRIVDSLRDLIERGALIESVVVGGGVVTHQPALERAIADRLALDLGLELTVVREPPVAGAVRLAASLAWDPVGGGPTVR